MYKKGLVIGILTLLIGVNIGSTFAGDVEVKTMSPVGFDGDTLYVGGSGPNNYTTIQSAIDDALDGDTVFVYSGFYNEGEHEVTKSINIIGEDKNTTIVSNIENGVAFRLKENNIKLTGFTIQNCSISVFIYFSHNNKVYNNIIQNNSKGGLRLDRSDNNHIFDNIFKNNGHENQPFYHGAITARKANNITIEYNIFESNSYGLAFNGGSGNLISNNVIAKNTDSGIFLNFVDNSIIILNHIVINNLGIKLRETNRITIKNNNIFNNYDDVQLIRYLFHRNILHRWKNNYWGSFYNWPKIIREELNIPVGIGDKGDYIYKPIPWFYFDWNPAKEPYDIGGT